MTLETWATIAEIFGSSAVIGAIIFGYLQVRQFQTQRRDLIAIELVRSFQDELLPLGYQMFHTLPAGTSADELKALGESYTKTALMIGMRYETIGLLVYRGIIPIDIVDELVGGVCLVIWQRINNWIFATREEIGHPALMEWYEWLARELEKRNNTTAPAR